MEGMQFGNLKRDFQMYVQRCLVGVLKIQVAILSTILLDVIQRRKQTNEHLKANSIPCHA